MILGLIFLQFGAVFRSLNVTFNSVADFIYGASGTGDVVRTWLNQLSAYVASNGFDSFWGLVTGSIVGYLTAMLIVIGLIILPITYTIFTLFYAMYGALLYVMGPFILALIPAKGIGQIGRTYAVNMMIFQTWGLLYAIMQVFMSAINLNSMNNFLNGNGLLQGLQGSSQMILLGVISILFSVAIAIIPIIASRIVKGDVGSAVMSTMNTIASAGRIAAAAVAGAAAGGPAGVAAATGGTSTPSGGAALASAGSAPRVTNSSSGASGSSQGVAPSATRQTQSSPGQTQSGSRQSQPNAPTPGQFRGFNYAHAAGWGTAYAATWTAEKMVR